MVTQRLAETNNDDIDLARATEENQNRLIDPDFAGKVQVMGDEWGLESARLFFGASNTLLIAENTDSAKLRAASLAVSQRVPMVTYDDSVRPGIQQLANDLGVHQILIIGSVAWATSSGEVNVIKDPGNTKAMGQYTAFQFTSKVVADPARMVKEVAALDADAKTELKAAWEPLPQETTKEKMPAIPAQARRDSQMAPTIVATEASPLASVANANAYGGMVLVMPNPDPRASKVGAAMTAGLSEGPIVALGPEFGSAKEFADLISQGWEE